MEGYLIISDERINCYGIKVLTAGIDFTDYLRNPVLLFNHDYSIIVGKVEDLKVVEGKLIGKPVFDDADNAEGAKLKGKWDRGYLKACSANLDMVETELQNDQLTLSKSILTEVSVTPVPGNKNALRLTKGGKLLEEKQLKLTAESILVNSNNNTMSHLKVLAGLLGLALTASEDDVQTKIKAIQEENTKLTNENASLKLKAKEVDDAAKAALETKCLKLVNDAFNAGKITAEEKESTLTAARANYESTEMLLSKLPGRKSASDNIQNANGENTNLQLTGERASWTFKEWEKKDNAGLQLMKKQNPEQYKALLDGLSKSLKEKGAIS